MLEVGETFERYRVEAQIGAGGLAAVFRVRHLRLGTAHALKVLQVTTPTDRARLLAEGRVQARLRHPNVVAVTDLLSIDRAPALVMELVDGPTLEQRLKDGALPPDEALRLFRDIVAGVGAAHALGVVHRDLKPANVLLAPGGGGPPIAKVTDFGLVRVVDAESHQTATGTAVGTPAYMAPEQIRDPSGVDARADLWALGCVLYEMLTGRRAFADADPFALYGAIAAGMYPDPEPLAPGTPRRAIEAVRALLHTDRDDRPGSCSELWGLLWDDPPPSEFTDAPLPDDSLLEEPEPTPPTLPRNRRPAASPPPPSAVPVGRYLAAGLALVLALAVVGVASTLGRPAPPADPPPVEAPPVVAPADPPPVAVPEPAPAIPAPTPTPVEPPAPPPTGRVAVEGNAAEVFLDANGKRVEVGDAVPEGHYALRVVWTPGSEPKTVTELDVSAHKPLRVKCASFVFACKVTDDPTP